MYTYLQNSYVKIASYLIKYSNTKTTITIYLFFYQNSTINIIDVRPSRVSKLCIMLQTSDY